MGIPEIDFRKCLELADLAVSVRNHGDEADTRLMSDKRDEIDVAVASYVECCGRYSELYHVPWDCKSLVR